MFLGAPGVAPAVGPGSDQTPQQPTRYYLRTPDGTFPVTSDAQGNPLPGVTVDVFNSVTKQWMWSGLSDANGMFQAEVPNGDPDGDGTVNATYFATFFLIGSPTVAGITINNLVATAG